MAKQLQQRAGMLPADRPAAWRHAACMMPMCAPTCPSCAPTGNMGSPMAAALLKAGHKLLVVDRNPAAVERLQKLGAQVAASPRQVAETPGGCLAVLVHARPSTRMVNACMVLACARKACCLQAHQPAQSHAIALAWVCQGKGIVRFISHPTPADHVRTPSCSHSDLRPHSSCTSVAAPGSNRRRVCCAYHAAFH